MKNILVKLSIIILMLHLSVKQLHAQANTSATHQAVIAGDVSTIKSLLEADATLLECKDKDGKNICDPNKIKHFHLIQFE